MNPSSPQPDFELHSEDQSENRLADRAAPALKRGESVASKPTPALPAALPMRGEVFDVALDQNGQIAGEVATPRGASAWFFAGLAALFCAYNLGAYVGQKSKNPAPLGPFTAQKQKLAPLRIQIAGKVKKPGVYSLPGGARLEDALKQAGGALPNADLSALNLADWAVDGSKIEVPARQTVKIEPTPTPVIIVKEVFVTPPQNAPEERVESAPRAALKPLAKLENTEKPQKGDAKPRPKAKTGGKSSEAALALLRRNPIDLNKASAEQLAVLPGVGPKMAERIVIYRKENGGFKSVADLDQVKGIGEKRMATLKDLVKVK